MNEPLRALEIVNCEMGAITSRADHSVTFKIVTPELRASEAGALMQWHGRACSVVIAPHDNEPADILKVTTDREHKTAAQRLRSVLFVLWKHQGEPGLSEHFYETHMEKMIEHVKSKLP